MFWVDLGFAIHAARRMLLRWGMQAKQVFGQLPLRSLGSAFRSLSLSEMCLLLLRADIYFRISVQW